MPKVRRALIFSVAGNYGSLIIGFGSTIIVSRLLGPAEVGAFAVALALITVLDTLRDLNITAYGVQVTQIDAKILSSLFGISLAVSVPLAILTLAASPWLGQQLGGGNLSSMLFIMAPTFLISPFTVPVLTVLRRDLRFNELLCFKLGPAIVRAILGIALIFTGKAALSLAVGYSASKLAEFLILLRANVRYKFVHPSIAGWRQIVSFSSVATAAQILGTIGVSVAEIFTGRFLGLADAGFYNRGAVLTNVYRTGVESAVLPVAFSAFAEERRKSEPNLRGAYLTGLTFLSSIGWPSFAILAVLARPLTLTLFGPAWASSSEVTQILSFGYGIYILSAMGPNLLIAVGQVRSFLRRELLIQIPRLGFILLGAQFGIASVAWAVVLTYLLAFWVNHTALQSAIGITYSDVWKASRKSLALTAIVASPLAILDFLYSSSTNDVVELVAGTSIAGCLWILGVIVIDHPVKVEVVAAMQGFRRRYSRA